ncbi:head-tail connector protein [Bordetella bronchialis]|uniref:Phage gp6-like head-tail connector protein n=1 Tax=Bordetella bronchialis TaxID=463025 RepID=A0A193FWZ1_9BORD|nr:head-tail connector protein [Bordetella bronchialis]ANN66466.1 hypothetical protein BAU06_09310 [Bordetella bronchialis]ANN71544.1 hypothetical protein BAU08_09520 [Bordetella bronchialis]
MALLTAEQCRAQCRVTGDYDDAELADKLASAENAVSAHLNRNVYVDQEALDAAVNDLADAAGQAQEAYDQAVAAAAGLSSDAAREMALQVAEKRLADFRLNAQRTLNGIVANGSILAAVRLTLGHLYANRESVATGVTVAELPLGVADLLRPYRLVMMP